MKGQTDTHGRVWATSSYAGEFGDPYIVNTNVEVRTAITALGHFTAVARALCTALRGTVATVGG